MERKNNWLNWAALVVGALALVLALGNRREQTAVSIQIPNGPAAAVAPAAPAAPNANTIPGEGPRAGQRGDAYNNGGDFGRGDAYGPRGGYEAQYRRPHFGPFGFFGGILKFFGFLLIVGLVMRFIFGRRGWGGPPWRRGWGGPPWQQGQHGPHGQPAPSQQPPVKPEGGSDDETPSTGETVRL